jgi:hypothetical protein
VVEQKTPETHRIANAAPVTVTDRTFAASCRGMIACSVEIVDAALREHPEGTLLVTTTRVHGTDDVAPAQVRPLPASGGPRQRAHARALLAAVRRRVERGSGPA